MSIGNTRLPLLCPGNWTEPDEDAVIEVLRVFRANHPAAGQLTPASVLGVRTLMPSFYPGHTLAEVLLNRQDSGASLVAIYTDEMITTFDGSSPAIHALNKSGALKMETSEDAVGYLSLFCALVCGEEGAFYNVTSGEEVVFSGERDPSVDSLGIIPQNVIAEPSGDSKDWHVEAHVQYSHALFKASFKIEPSGMTNMTGDSPIKDSLALLSQKFTQGMRILAPAKIPQKAQA